MWSWFSDIIRLVWGFGYWNLRKTLFRLRRGRGHCPCQNASDPGRAMMAACDPASGLSQPSRFRVVCPLLQSNDEGLLRCSVDAADVRPFWGRVFVGGVSLVLVLYFIGALGVFGLLRQVGYPVTVTMIAWPPAWSQIDEARSTYFLKNAQEAYAESDLGTAVMSLSLAYEYDPQNYEAGFFLARIWQTSRPGLSNHLYQSLLLSHPDRRSQTAQAWLRALLPRADYAMIEQLTRQALRFSDDYASAWLYALLFANYRTGDGEIINELLAEPTALSPGVETVLRWEQLVQSLPPDLAHRTLLRPAPPDAPPFVIYYQINRLLTLGYPAEALELITTNEARLTDRDRIKLQLDALAGADYARSRQALFDQLSGMSPSLAQYELLAAHLIRYPDVHLYTRAKSRLRPSQLNANEQIPAMIVLFCLAGVHEDYAYQTQLIEDIRNLADSQFAPLDIAQKIMQSAGPNTPGIERILPALQPLSLDLTYALLAHYETIEY